MSRAKQSNHITTERPDDLQNPLMMNPLSPPDEILSPVTVNMHAEERQGRKIAWIMDDLNRDIAKLRVIFVERLTEPTEKEDREDRSAADMSHGILKNLTSISDWLSEINIDGESFSLPIGEEDMKTAQEKPLERKVYIEDQAQSLQNKMEDVVEKTLKLTKFISGRQNVFEKFLEYIGETSDSKRLVSKLKMEGISFILDSLRKAEIENYDEVEKVVVGLEDSLVSEKDKSRKLKERMYEMKQDIEKYHILLKAVTNIRSMIAKFIKETEITVAKAISDESIRMGLATNFNYFKDNFNKEFLSIKRTKSVGMISVKKFRRSVKKRSKL